ncbi:MAG: DUF2513 domain-containing protein [Planctomycetales bacterium]|nr:DUF2513 domain-containing protein [Planctomycetales bacterium]
MKRDLDLVRQLLADIENRGSDCSVSVLRSGPNHEAEERIRYHLRLLIDGGLLKEVDRTTTGVPCVRLTHDGHELLELARSEGRWREAKHICQERTGGLSLTVIRNILVRLAVVGGRPLPRRRYFAPAPIRSTLDYGPRPLPAYDLPRYEPWRHELSEAWQGDEAAYARYYADRRNGYYKNGVGVDVDGDGIADFTYDATLPDYLI